MSAVLRMLIGLLAIAVIVLPVVAVLNGWIGVQRFAFHRLQIEGALTPEETAELRQVLAPRLQRGFFATHLEDAQSAVSALPWVAHAEVSKHWPDVVQVSVIEQRPFAFWGDQQLVSTRGMLYPRLASAALPKDLPQLDGDSRNVAAMLALYAKASEAFSVAGIAIKRLEQGQRGSWSIGLSNGTQLIVGRADPQQRIERFARLMPRLLSQMPGRALERADLRYTNGFALTWQGAAGAEKNAPPAAPADPDKALPAPLPTPIAALSVIPHPPFPISAQT